MGAVLSPLGMVLFYTVNFTRLAVSNHQISLWEIPLPSVYAYSLPIWVPWAAKTIGSLEERRMGPRRRFVEQFCHAALLETTDVVSFHHEPAR